MVIMESFVARNDTVGVGAQRYDVIVIGAGQAGLSIGYYLARQGRRFVILDERERAGDSWRSRWESLRLFTPARFDALPGMPFPAPPHTLPTRDEMADYLEAYARELDLPVCHGMRVDGLWVADDGYILTSGDLRFKAPQVVVATGALSRQRVPDFARELHPGIRQITSGDYQSPSRLQPGSVLVVGAGNSGAEIAMEVVRDHRTLLVGRHPGHLPVALEGRIGYVVDHVIWFAVHYLLTNRNPVARKVAVSMRRGHSGPIERIRPKHLQQAGVERSFARVTGVRDGLPLLDDGTVVDTANVIWCTGFRPDFGWLHLPIPDEDGYPVTERGIVPSASGLYFLGLPFQYAGSSALVGGAGRDAAYIADRISAYSQVR